MARKLESREASKICITNDVASKFYKDCSKLAQESGFQTKIHRDDLIGYQERLLDEQYRQQHKNDVKVRTQQQHEINLEKEKEKEFAEQEKAKARASHDPRKLFKTSKKLQKNLRKKLLRRPRIKLTKWQEKLLLLGFFKNNKVYQDAKILELIEAAVEEIDEVDGEWFYFADFLFYSTVR